MRLRQAQYWMHTVYDRNMEDIKSADAQIVYDDEFLRVIWQPGQADFVLVTFGNLINLAKGTNFFGDVPVRKLGFTCIGFMAKRPNWFPEESTRKAILAVQKFFYGVREVITYGGSMGGYAAIKYSSALKAKIVIAFCPQWSIDRAECDGHNPGFQEYFSPSLSGMGIQTKDVAGHIFLFYDPKHTNDAFHAQKITSKAANAKHIPVRSVGHYVTGTLAGTANMDALINMARLNDHHGLCKLADRVRRGHHLRIRSVLNKLATRHPYLLKKVMQTPGNTQKLGSSDIVRLNTEMLKSFTQMGQRKHSIEAIDALKAGGICPVRRRVLVTYRQALNEQISADQQTIQTHHKTVVAYSALDGGLVHRPKAEVLSSLYLLPVGLYNYLGRHVFAVQLDGSIYLCQVSKFGDVRLGDIFGADLELDTLITGFDSKATSMLPKCRGTFVTAEKSGVISFNRKVAKEWETYKLC